MKDIIEEYLSDHMVNGHFVVEVPYTFDAEYNETMLMCADFTVSDINAAVDYIANEFERDQVEVSYESLVDYFNMQVAYDRPLIDGFSVAEEYNTYVEDNLF